MARTLPQDCRPRNRCHNWRECASCAHIRQARIADTAEALLADYMQLQLIVIKPHGNTPAHMQRAIKCAIRNNGLRAGIWTIERGTKAGTLHANILTHGGTIRTHRSAEQHTSIVRHGARVTAAYISKQGQAPGREHYTGKTYGAWGRACDFLTSPDIPATVQAAAIERDIGGLDAPPPDFKPTNRPAPTALPPPSYFSGLGQAAPVGRLAPPDLTRDQYREIAARNLPHLAALSDSFKRRFKEAEITYIK